MDERKILLEDVLQFLEWQKHCGADAWKVDDISIWERRLSALIQSPNSTFQKKMPQQIEPETSSSSRSTAKNPAKNSSDNPASNSKQEQVELGGLWGQLLNDAPATIDFSLLNEGNGLKVIKNHQEKHCKHHKPCVFGRGRARNPILLIEGHPKGLTANAKESLGKILDNVLQINRTEMYWLPYPMTNSAQQGNCALCPNLFWATLECLNPKLILVMGEGLKEKIKLSIPEKSPLTEIMMGQEIQMETKKWTVPTVWTHHPTDMAQSPSLKKGCVQHLLLFQKMMRRMNL